MMRLEKFETAKIFSLRYDKEALYSTNKIIIPDKDPVESLPKIFSSSDVLPV